MFFNPTSRNDQRLGTHLLLLMAVVASLYVAVTWTASQARRTQQEALAGGGSASHARLGAGTESLLGQTAAHVSKLLAGESVGGFPGFEPPDDDEHYRSKVRNQSYSGEEANTWLKEINNFLRQVIDKNPNLTLKEILGRMGWQQSEINEFVIALRNTHSIARAWKGIGVTPTTLETLETLMKTLGVIPWP